MNTYKSGSHNIHLLQYHLILVCKYRFKLLTNKDIDNNIKNLAEEICIKHNVIIRYMESDKDHIHLMLETTPNINLSNFVRTLKSYTTFHVWKEHECYLSEWFKRERTFWSDSYFISSIGNVSSQTLKHYILNQGSK